MANPVIFVSLGGRQRISRMDSNGLELSAIRVLSTGEIFSRAHFRPFMNGCHSAGIRED